ncbi:hypothetical protein MCOR21_006514 [Pyricularia oryzae]|uniref:Protein kinase domain-containing protein n=1 Tax=Pyricularia grisea TaxID=148305 RepID=A0ABQ8N418_PYRGI|nr:hypothetical protein MCOR26_005154 [Pyricularia oryzae]KAI6290914.1 hypothetical protein MCOR33_010972 [Pyricularia grisea]KAI6385130.1 hypothetical protein MCOR32_001728 [Pyricularia oryzae]KAI6426134.1 hypothetical protein MCOR24_002970 [Pyricularia oryzae]KAI6426789.1 hypothetical protein MCOR21_006514 [Pyricularia oryzae]
MTETIATTTEMVTSTRTSVHVTAADRRTALRGLRMEDVIGAAAEVMATIAIDNIRIGTRLSLSSVAEEHKNGAKDDKRDPGSKQSESQAEDWEPPSVVDEEAEIERRRRRREELLRKSRASTPMQQQLLAASAAKLAVSTPESTQANTPQRTEVNTPRSDAVSPDRSPAQANDAGTPEALDMFTEQDLVNTHNKGKSLDEDGPSAADYDPTADRKEDERRDEMRHGNVGLHGEGPNTNNASALGNGEVMEQETDTGAPKAADDEDDDDFDMFSTAPPERYVAPKKSAQAAGAEDEAGATQLAQGNGGGILEGDDKDGYYKIRPGEILDGRYQIQSALGKGMFSGVARAMDITNKKLVAIKIMRNNDALRKGGFTEIAILQKLNDADPENKKHIVKFERSFEYKGHLCMAFENLSLNLREVLKKFGNNVGINLRGVRAYAYQIFLALGHMRRCSIIHADLKPDNILVNDQRNVLKICDLGTAIDRSDAATAHNEITPYLVSRFYRAPEIILGIPYDYAADMWSIGCTLYEMYTGKILFTGDSNNQMLRAIMEIRGKMSRKLYQRGELWQMHFDEVGNFFSQERDKVLGKRSVAVALLVSRSRMRRRTNNDKWRGNNSIFTSPASFSRTRDSEDAPRQDNLSAESPHPSTSTRLKTRPFGPCVGDFNYAQRVGF